LFGEAKSKFYFKNYKITCIAEDIITLPFYKGPAFRGSFGLNLKRASCFKELKDDCKTCEFKNTCVYSYIFESTTSEELPIIGKVKDIPRPLVIEPPLSPKRFYKAGEEFSFNIILIGTKANSYLLQFFLKALYKMGVSGIGEGKHKFIVKSIDTNFDSFNIYNLDGSFTDYRDMKSDLIYENFKWDSSISSIKLNFLTPIRIIHNGKLWNNPELPFHILYKQIAKRFFILSYLYNEWSPHFSYLELLSLAKSVKIKMTSLEWSDEIKRFSTKRKEEMIFGGLIGNIEYNGNLQLFMPFLNIGKHIHIGEKTTFGLGKYEIIQK
jgi:hypothetical protein